MRGPSGAIAALVAATLVAAPLALAEDGPTRAEYISQVEPICKSNIEANKRILKGARQKVNSNRMPQAGQQFIRAAQAFGKAVNGIMAVPRPSADNTRLEKWFGFLRIVQQNLAKVGKALKEEKRVKATHETIRAERSANAANNVSSVFAFHYCHISPSQFR